MVLDDRAAETSSVVAVTLVHSGRAVAGDNLEFAGRSNFTADLGEWNVRGPVKFVEGIQSLVIKFHECAAVEVIDSGLRQHFDLSAAVPAVLGRREAGDDLQFLYRFRIWRNHCGAP